MAEEKKKYRKADFDKYFIYRKYRDFARLGQHFTNFGPSFVKRAPGLIDELKSAESDMLNQVALSNEVVQCKKLEDLYNGFLKWLNREENQKSHDDFFNQLILRTDGVLDDISKKGLTLNDIRGSNHTINIIEKNAEQNFQKVYENYKKKNPGLNSNDIMKEPEVKKAFFKMEDSLKGLNKTRGILFESYLQILTSYFSESLTSMETDILEKEYQGVIESLKNMNLNEKIKTAGSEYTKQVEITLGDPKKNKNLETLEISKVQQKTDISLKDPFSDSNLINISAKNYLLRDSSQNIELISKQSSLLGLVATWDHVDTKTKQWYLSALTYYDNENSTRNNFINAGLRLITIQGLVGKNNIIENGQLANYFVVQDRTSKKIRVLPTRYLLAQAFAISNIFNKEVGASTAFSYSFTPNFPYFKKGDEEGRDKAKRTYASIQQAVHKAHIGIHLKQTFFKSLVGNGSLALGK